LSATGVRTFNETLKLFLTDGFGLHLDLKGHEDGEEELVGFVETSRGVGEGQIGQVLDDVLDASRGERRPVRLRHGEVEQLQKLSQRSLIHAVDAAHCHDQEVQHRTTCSHYTTPSCTLYTGWTFANKKHAKLRLGAEIAGTRLRNSLATSRVTLNWVNSDD